MIPDRRDLIARSRQVPFTKEWGFLDGTAPFNFADWSAKLQVRLYGGAAGAPLIDLETVTAPGEGLRFIIINSTDDSKKDGLRITINKSTLQGLPGLNQPEAGAMQRFPYDLVMTPPSGSAAVWLFGDLIVPPGVTV